MSKSRRKRVKLTLKRGKYRRIFSLFISFRIRFRTCIFIGPCDLFSFNIQAAIKTISNQMREINITKMKLYILSHYIKDNWRNS